MGTLHCYPADTFYGLPRKVQSCLEENRGIKKLYGRQDMTLHNQPYLVSYPGHFDLFLPSVCYSSTSVYHCPTMGNEAP